MDAELEAHGVKLIGEGFESFAIGGLVAAGALPAALALESLGWAARQMPSYDRRRSWHAAELDKQVRNSFLDGQLHPRAIA